MPTVYDAAVRHATENLTGEQYELYAETLRKLRTDYYDRTLVDMIFQVDHRVGYGLETAYAFANVFAQILSGKILTAKIQIGFLPMSDKYVGDQRAALLEAMNEMLPTELSEHLGGVPQDEDGWIRFPAGEVEFARTLASRKAQRMQRVVMHGFVERIPLEIGTTSAAKTMYQLQRGPLARWPYGSKDLFVMYAPDEQDETTVDSVSPT